MFTQLKSHQYSATHFERDVAEGGRGDTPQGVYLQHGVSGVPGMQIVLYLSYKNTTNELPHGSLLSTV